MKRREFLKRAAVTAATVAASSQLKAKTPAQSNCTTDAGPDR